VNKGSYSEADAVNLVRQLMEAIQYVHNLGIAHRDLKPENLLLEKGERGQEVLKIADFGLSKDFSQEQLQTSCGTPDYVAPEVLLGEPYGIEVDIWSIGVIAYVLLCGFPPFYGETQKELFEAIMSARYEFPAPEWTSISKEAKDFIRKILVVNPEDRYTAQQALADPWIKHFQPTSSAPNAFNVQKLKQYHANYKNAKGM